MRVAIEIPVRRYIYKYLKTRYNGVLEADNNFALGASLLAMLTPNTQKPNTYKYLARERTNRVRLAVPLDGLTVVSLSQATVWRIERLIDERFREEMMLFLVNQRVHAGGMKIRAALDVFMKLFGMEEEDLDVDTCIRYYSRHHVEYLHYYLKMEG